MQRPDWVIEVLPVQHCYLIGLTELVMMMADELSYGAVLSIKSEGIRVGTHTSFLGTAATAWGGFSLPKPDAVEGPSSLELLPA